MAALLVALLWTAAGAVGPPFPPRQSGQHLVDDANVIPNAAQDGLEEALRAIAARDGIDLVIYTQTKPRARTPEDARADAEALFAEWQVGDQVGDGAVMLWDLDRKGEDAIIGYAIGPGLAEHVDQAALEEAVGQATAPSLASGDWTAAMTQAIVALSLQVGQATAPQATPAASQGAERTPRPRPTSAPGATRAPVPTLPPAAGAGPPYPEPVDGLRVYDYANLFDRDTEAIVSERIRAIEERTGAQLVVYTQDKPESDSFEKAQRDAAALMDQWGVGRAGIDDGMVILFDMRDACHGQVQLYAGPGFASSYLTNEDRQRIFEEEMLPALRQCQLDDALVFALERIDESATPERAATLQLARQVDAVSGLIVAPLLLITLVAWAGWSWIRYGRDPQYLDDKSILMPAPPPAMTPAAAAVVIDGRVKQHALTTALVDLASRGEVAFRPRREGSSDRAEIEITIPDESDPRLARNRRPPIGEAEMGLLRAVKELAGGARLVALEDMPRLHGGVSTFDHRLEELVAERGWFREPPSRSTERWAFRAGAVLVLGAVGAFLGIILPSSGLLLVGGALVAASICMFVLAWLMPQRTMEGARMFAQLAAYRRTLERTMERSRTMDQVVASGVLPWVQTPDQAVVWAYALGLHEEVEELLERSVADVRTGAASPTRTYFPTWYLAGATGGSGRGSGGAFRGMAPGLFSGSAMPDFGAMTAALSTIGQSPSSGGSGGGGFGGGGSGGGGGGAGGGF